MVSRTVFAAVATWSITGVLLAQSPPTQAKDGVFTAEQASRGQSHYAVFCAGCHADDLGGTNSGDSGAPPLKHDTFMRGSTAEALFTKIQKRMPLDAPGSLSDEQVAELTAYLLKANGFPAGAMPLPTAREDLGRILIR